MSETERGYAHELFERASSMLLARNEERAQLDAALERAQDQPVVCFLLGPAGVGKSALASLFRLKAQSLGHRVAWLSGEETDANRAGFVAALAERDMRFEDLGRGPLCDVLVVDSFEQISRVGTWLFTEALPRAGRRLLVVLSSRSRLGPTLRSDAAVAPVLQELQIQPLRDTGAAALLDSYDVPEQHHADLFRTTGGLPLALTLVGERFRRGHDDAISGSVPSAIVPDLALAFLRETESTEQRQALYALARVRRLNESMLRRLVLAPPAPLYDFLRGLSFVSEEPRGLVPHSLVRDTLQRDQLQRDPEGAKEMAVRAVREILTAVRHDNIVSHRARLIDALFAMRDQGGVPALDMDNIAQTDLARVDDDNIVEVAREIQADEGEASAELFKTVHELGALHAFVISDSDGAFYGLNSEVTLDDLPADVIDSDVVLSQARHIAAEFEGRIGCARWFFVRDGYQEFSPAFTPVICAGPTMSWSREIITEQLIYAPSSPEQWAPIAEPFRMKSHGPVFEDNGRRRQCFVREVQRPGETRHRDQLLAEATLEMVLLWGGVLPDEPLSHVEVSIQAGEDEVREALAMLRDPDALSRCRMMRFAPSNDTNRKARTESLATHLRGAIAELGEHPGYREFADVLRVTYVDGAVKQRAAASDLGMTYGTYRNRLRRSIELLTLQLRGEV